MRLPGRLLVGLALVVLTVGVAVSVLLQPQFTQMVAGRVSEYAEAGISREVALGTADEVRTFVASTGVLEGSELPATVAGRPGFDAAAISHLRDVARVLEQLRLLTGLVGMALTVWLLAEVIRRRTTAIASGLRMGAYISAGGVALAAIIGLTSFDRFFTAFHGVFFKAGTWTFPYDSLLIRLFPEPFWMTAAAALGLLVLLGAGVLLLMAIWLERSAADPTTVWT